MNPETQTANPAATVVGLTVDQKAREDENVRLGHAVVILNNHMPMFGARPYVGDDSWKGAEPGPLMGECPADLQQAMHDVLLSAARFASHCFSKDCPKPE